MNKQSKGSLYILTSAMFFATYGVWSRLMAGSFGHFAQAWTRGAILLLVVYLIGKVTKSYLPVAKRDWPWLVTMGLAGGLNQAPYFFGFEHLGVGTATLLFYASLVLGGYVLGKAVFNEAFSVVKILSFVLALAGMGVLYQFSLSSYQVLPAIATVIAGILGSVTVILPKKLSKPYPELQIMQSFFVAQILINLPISLVLTDGVANIEAVPWLAQFGYATSMLIANAMAIAGFKRLEPSVGSILGTTEIIFGILFGVGLFAEALPVSSFWGAGLIILATILPEIKKLRKYR